MTKGPNTMSRSAECRCEIGRFTCGHCLRNAKPYFYTLSDGSAIYHVPFQGTNRKEEFLALQRSNKE